MNQVLREEKKFLIGIHDFLQASNRLEQVLIQDPHNGTHGYVIRSLYFDTPLDDDFMEKLDGTELRRKIRLRIYDPGHNFAMLEMKQKQGDQQLKRSLRVSKVHAQRLQQGDYTPLSSSTFVGTLPADLIRVPTRSSWLTLTAKAIRNR